MTDDLFERYKDALRRGHVAALRDRSEEALAAYAEAEALVPGRPLATISRAGVLLKTGRAEEALAGYEQALRLAPRDTGALAGRAASLARLGRRSDAADAYDVVAEIHQAEGKTVEACEMACHALEQAESKSRRRFIEALARILREAGGDAAAEAALARAELVLGGAGLSAAAGERAGEVAPPAPPPPDATALAIEAEAALDVGDVPTALERLLASARAHQREGRSDAALDACYMALAIAPADTDLHLLLVDLYLARGWRAPAADKLFLLGQLIAYDADAASRERLCAVIAARFADDARLTAICA